MSKGRSIPGGGINNVLQKNKEKCGQGGKMNQKPAEKANWKRNSGNLTPRKA